MARALKGTVTVCLALGLASLALGQQRQPAPQPQISVLGPVLSDPRVQKELKLKDDQVNKLKEVLSKVAERYKEDFQPQKLRQMSPEEQQKKVMAMTEDSHKAVAGVLDTSQWKRFKQIQWQLYGVHSLLDPELQKGLKLSDDQKRKLEGVFNNANKKMEEMSRTPPTTREEAQKKFEAFAKDVEEKANGVLSEEQKKNLKELKGPPFQPATQGPGAGK